MVLIAIAELVNGRWQPWRPTNEPTNPPIRVIATLATTANLLGTTLGPGDQVVFHDGGMVSIRRHD